MAKMSKKVSAPTEITRSASSRASDAQGADAKFEQLLQGALAWAKQGFPVVPFKIIHKNGRPTKTTCTTHGIYDAEVDADKVRELFERCRGIPTLMIAVPTGERSGVDILDVDPKNGGHLWTRINELPKDMPIHTTMSGGWHYPFKHLPGLKSSQSIVAPGIDVLADGRCFIVPPTPGYSVNAPWGCTETPELAPDIAAWYASLLHWPTFAESLALQACAKHSQQERKPGEHITLHPVPPAECEKTLEFALNTIRHAKEGNKHHTLLKMARLVGGYVYWTQWTRDYLWERFREALFELLVRPVMEGGKEWKTFMDGMDHGELYRVGFEIAYVSHHPAMLELTDLDSLKYREELEPVQQMPGNMVPGFDTNNYTEVLKFMDRHYRFVDIRGKIRIAEEKFIPGRYSQTETSYMTVDNFRLKFCNRFVNLRTSTGVKRITWAEYWLMQEERKTYNQVLFNPRYEPCTHDNPTVYPLWRGYTVKRAKGDCSKFTKHMLEVLCSGNQENYEYFLKWNAHMFQHPEEQCGVLVALYTEEEGAGKNIYTRYIIKIYGRHATEISKADEVAGRFNQLLEGKIFVNCNEAFFARDPRHRGPLNTIITDDRLHIELKHFPSYDVDNALHIVICTNAKHILFVSIKGRRVFAPKVSEKYVVDLENITEEERAGAHAYFKAIRDEMDNGGMEAFLEEMLSMDLTGFNVRACPITDLLREQKELSLMGHDAWWSEVVEREYVLQSKGGLEHELHRWMSFVSYAMLYQSYGYWHDEQRGRQGPKESQGAMIKYLEKIGYVKGRQTAPLGEGTAPGGMWRPLWPAPHSAPRGFVLGELEAAKMAFYKHTGISGIEEDAGLPAQEAAAEGAKTEDAGQVRSAVETVDGPAEAGEDNATVSAVAPKDAEEILDQLGPSVVQGQDEGNI